ncbi:MAG: prepilin-type N-terminal cleavage/methylation domain-containing protein [Gemmatimonadales bacterium]|nr:MAG: prepilin-type N-terminal cleavage/methylation domain-containing protein [Gemmatimonadales bacterium]
MSAVRGGSLGNRRGVSLVELLVAMAVGLLLLAVVAPVTMMANRSSEQQRSQQSVQTAVYVGAEMLMRGIRGVEAIRAGSDGDELFLEGGELEEVCGATEFAIWVVDGALHCGPDVGDPLRRIMGEVESIDLSYGFDTQGDGRVDTFRNSVGASDEDEVRAVRFRFGMRAGEGRGDFRASPEFVAVIRNAVLADLQIGGGG